MKDKLYRILYKLCFDRPLLIKNVYDKVARDWQYHFDSFDGSPAAKSVYADSMMKWGPLQEETLASREGN